VSVSPSPITPATGWNVETVLDHLTSLIGEHDKRYAQRFDAQERALEKVEAATESRFQSVNEFRGSLNDVLQKQMPRQESVALHDAARERIDKLEAEVQVARSDRNSMKLLIAGAVGLLGVVATIVSLIFAFRRP
jgi:predicted nucleic acid-binding protein